MKLRILLLFILPLLYCSSAQSQTGNQWPQSWFVRPSTSCAFNGDGLSYECAQYNGGTGAFNSFVGINWTPVAGVDKGDILFVCGEHSSTFVIPSHVTGDDQNHITVDFLCPNDRGKIRTRTVLSNALDPASWINTHPNIWRISLTQFDNFPRRVWTNGVEQIMSESFGMLGVRSSSGPYGPVRFWWYDISSKSMYVFSKTNPSQWLTSVETLSSTNTGCSYASLCILRPTNKYIDVLNPILEGGGLGSLFILGASNIRVLGIEGAESCHIGGFAGRGILISDSGSNGTGAQSDSIEIGHCRLDPYLPSYLSGYQHELNGVTHDGISAFHGVNNSWFHDLVIRSWQHTGVTLIAHRGVGSVNNNILERITYDCDLFVEYCRAFAVDSVNLSKASHNIFRDSVITNQTVRSQFNGDHNTVQNNIFMNQRLGSVTIGKSHISQVLESQGYLGPSEDNRLIGNVFYNNKVGPCFYIRPDTNTKKRFTISGNLFIDCGGTDTPGAEGVALFIPDEGISSQHVITRNIFVVPDGRHPLFYKELGKASVEQIHGRCVSDTCSLNTESYTDMVQVPVSISCTSPFIWEVPYTRSIKHFCYKQ